MIFYILASGSKGNITLVETDKYKFLIDCGISYKRTRLKFKEINKKLSEIDFIIITHEHRDHIDALKLICKNYPNIRVYLTKGTYNNLRNDVQIYLTNISFIKADTPFKHDNIEILPIMISHDAGEPVGFIIYKDNKKTVYITDTGYIHESYHDILSDADLYIMEANHDEQMLLTCNRPFNLKRRILSETGHLSNNQASEYFSIFNKNKKNTNWVVSHISEDCNEKKLFKKAFLDYNKSDNANILFSSQEKIVKVTLK